MVSDLLNAWKNAGRIATRETLPKSSRYIGFASSAPHVMKNGSKETPAQRRARYIRLSEEARSRAAKIKDRETREAYLALAEVWLALADQLDLD